MTNSDWKCPSCGYANQALDDRCESCRHQRGLPADPSASNGHGKPARRPVNWRGRLFGCLFLILILGAAGWLFATPSGLATLAGLTTSRGQSAEERQAQARLKEAQTSPEGKKEKRRLEVAGKEIERLVGVLERTTDPEVTMEALTQLTAAVDRYNLDYTIFYGYHAEMPAPITRAVDYSFAFAQKNTQSPFAPLFLDMIGISLLNWRLEDLRRYEPQLLQLLATAVRPLEQQPYSGSEIEIYRQLDEEAERNRKAQEQDEQMHSFECDLLEYGLYPERFSQLETENSEVGGMSILGSLMGGVEGLDVAHTRELIPQIRAAADNSQSTPAHELADRLEQLLHELGVKKAVGGGQVDN